MFFPQMSKDLSKAAIRGVILWLSKAGTHTCPAGEFLVSPQEKVTLWGGLSHVSGAVGGGGTGWAQGNVTLVLFEALGEHRALVGWTGLQVLPEKRVLRCTFHPPLRRTEKCPHLKPF